MAIRVILTELQRISSHLVFLATHALDIGAMSVFLYCFREREIILDIFEMCSGARMMTSFFRPGGLWRDVPEGFDAVVRPLYVDRTKMIGPISGEDALRWGLSGPPLRAAGVAWDLRKSNPYSGYEQYDFEIPTGTNGDVYDRYIVRIQEMRQSLRIIEQALNNLPGGPVRSDNRKFVPPPRAELGVSMEAVIHHFKLWTEGFPAPKASVYLAVESPRGELGCYLEGDGGPKPYRVHFRTPSFAVLQTLPMMSEGFLVADLVAIISSLDPVLGDSDR
jgi:NADH-quinone oxidoreductase subunit D